MTLHHFVLIIHSHRNCRKQAERIYRLCNHFYSSSALSSIFYVFPSFVRSHLFFCRISSAGRKQNVEQEAKSCNFYFQLPEFIVLIMFYYYFICGVLFAITRMNCSASQTVFASTLFEIRLLTSHPSYDGELSPLWSILASVSSESWQPSASGGCLNTTVCLNSLPPFSPALPSSRWWEKRKSIVEAEMILCHSVSYNKHCPQFRRKFVIELYGRWQKFCEPWTTKKLKYFRELWCYVRLGPLQRPFPFEWFPWNRIHLIAKY